MSNEHESWDTKKKRACANFLRIKEEDIRYVETPVDGGGHFDGFVVHLKNGDTRRIPEGRMIRKFVEDWHDNNPKMPVKKVVFTGRLHWWSQIEGGIGAALDGEDSEGKKQSCTRVEDWLSPFYTKDQAYPGRLVKITVEAFE